ncbi:MAG TPA: hypothetical protein VEX68_00480 [Bryobacteraceae bacterium]|nr:hypothetical protein [Bryobacteraceae bacterium]
MLFFLQWAFWAIGLGLQIMLILTLSQGAGRYFPTLYVYIVCLLGTTVADILVVQIIGGTSPGYRHYYWSAELVRQSILFVLVVSLAIHVAPVNRRTNAMVRWMGLSAAAIWFGSVAACYSPNLNTWMTTVVRNLSFFTGVLNLIVWFLCARSQVRDPQRLLIAGGLGLQMTGEAIGQALRQMRVSYEVSAAGNIVIVATHLLCLFIWWRALSIDERYA